MAPPTDASEAPAPVESAQASVAVAEPAAEPPVAAEGPQLSLKVRTLDQKTYPITVQAGASVPQLKELVALETGVTLARQRLIYRGRVLKNDQPLAAYSLEDGHVLHLVARAAPEGETGADTGANQVTGSTSTSSDATARRDAERDARLVFEQMQSASHRSRARRARRSMRAPPPPRDNDEPDPTMGRSGANMPSRVLMGATIAVPEGADVTMPFLSSMIANLVTQVSDAGAVEAGTGSATTSSDGRRHVSFSREVVGGEGGDGASTAARVLRLHRRRDGSSGRSHSRRSSNSAERQAALRTRAGLRLDSMRATLDDASLDFPADLSPLEQGADAGPMAELQQQVETLQTLVERFGPRLRLLPAALAERDRLSDNRAQPQAPAAGGAATQSEAPASSETAPQDSAASTEPNAASATVSARHVIRAIETLQTIGESADLIARMARHAFVRQSMHLGEPIPRRGDAGAAGSDTSGRLSSATIATMEAATHSLRGSRTNRDSSRPRFRLARIRATALPHDGAAPSMTASTMPGIVPGSSSNFPVDLTGSSTSSAPPAPFAGPPAPSDQANSSSRRSAASQSGEGLLPPPPGPQISIAGLGSLPVMSSVVFPFSLAAGLNGNHTTTTWNMADFVSRLTSELPISTLYGVMAGDNTHVHHFLAHLGFALFSGVDVPRLSRPNIRTWAQDFVGELRSLLRSHALPADVMEQIAGPAERRSGLGNELVNAVEPFMPELIDTLVRATSASRAAAFGASSLTFLRTMARQVVRQLRSYARGDSTESADESEERLQRLLQRLLVWLGMNEHMAGYVVDSLLSWTEEDNGATAGRRGRTRRREESASTDGPNDSPANKRRRE